MDENMTEPILVVCTTCGVVFDLRVARTCGEPKAQHYGAEECFVCPLGHKGHDSRDWCEAPRREATLDERAFGIRYMLQGYDVKGA